MTILFNKDNNGADELRELTSSYFASNNFDRIKMKVLLAQEDVATVIGKTVMEKVLAHYNGDNYPDGDTDEQKFLTELVPYIQMPIAYKATFDYYQANELTHEDNGRKMKLDPNTERTPWQWQIDRDDYLNMRLYYKTLDRLILYLEENNAKITEWKDGNARKTANSLFIRNAKEFDRVFPIDESGSFFYAIVPFMQEIERRFILPVLGDDLSDLKEARIGTEDVSEANQAKIDAPVNAIPLLTMEMAVKRLSLQVLPEGVVQNYLSSSADRKASQAATLDHIKEVSRMFEHDGNEALDDLKELLLPEDDTESVITDFIPDNSENRKHFRT